MKLLYAILMGLIQGVTEFLPVSSSGHLAIFKQLLNLDDVTYVDKYGVDVIIKIQ